MGKIVIIAFPGTDGLEAAVSSLQSSGHEVEQVQPTLHNALALAMGFNSPDNYGFSVTNDVPVDDPVEPEEVPTEDTPPEEPVEEVPTEEVPSEDGDTEEVQPEESEDEFKFEDLGTCTVAGETVKAVKLAEGESYLAVTNLVVGYRTSYAILESTFAFYGDGRLPSDRVVVEHGGHETSIELPLRPSSGDTPTLFVGTDLISIFK